MQLLPIDEHSTTYITNILPATYSENDSNLITRDNKHYYLEFNFNSEPPLRVGFKIHISATSKNYQFVLNIIFNFCKQHSLNFKYISNITNVLNNLSGQRPVWESGKFITIYPTSFDNFKKTIIELSKLQCLQQYDGIDILSDKRYRNTNNIFYRYGIISSTDNFIYNPNNPDEFYEDYKKQFYYLPRWINEPFPNSSMATHSKLLFKKYVPTKALNNKASGSVFIAHKSKNKVILKTAKFGYTDTTNSAIQLLKNEALNLKQFKKYPFFPNFIDDFFEDKDYFLIEDYISGETVSHFRASVKNSFTDNNIRLKTILRYKNIILNLLFAMESIHEEGIFLGDISANNVLIDKDNHINFIDLSQSKHFDKISSKYKFYRTPSFYDKRTQFLSPKKQDIQQLGYLIMTMFTRSSMFLEIDPSGKTSFEHFRKYMLTYQIPDIFIKIVRKLIFNTPSNLTKIISQLNKYKFKFIPYQFRTESLNFDLNSFSNSLKKSIYTFKIDNQSFSFENNKINFENNLIFSDDLTKLKWAYLQSSVKITLSSSERNKLFFSLKNLNVMMKNIEQHSNLRKVEFSKILSLIFCSIQNIQNKNDENLVYSVLSKTLKAFKFENKSILSYRMSYDSNCVSPYLKTGLAGVLLNLLHFKIKTGRHDFDKLLVKIANNLKLYLMPKNGSLSEGLGGIIYTLNLYKHVFNTSRLDKYIIAMLNRLPLYTMNANNNVYLISSSFDQFSLNFPNGNEGITWLLNDVKTFQS